MFILLYTLRSRRTLFSSTSASSPAGSCKRMKYRAKALRWMEPSGPLIMGNFAFSRMEPEVMSRSCRVTRTSSPGKNSRLNSSYIQLTARAIVNKSRMEDQTARYTYQARPCGRRSRTELCEGSGRVEHLGKRSLSPQGSDSASDVSRGTCQEIQSDDKPLRRQHRHRSGRIYR